MKKILKYQMTDMIKSLSIYYLVIIILFGVSGVVTSLFPDNLTRMSDPNFSTTIFAFVVGIAIYKEHWLMAAQNGISRKTFFKSCISLSLIFSIMNIIFSKMFLFIFNLLFKNTPNFSVFNITELMYDSFFDDATVIASRGVNALFIFLIILAAYIVGLLIAAIYCRIPKKLKTTFVIALPISVFVGIPAFGMLFPNTATNIFNLFVTMMGLGGGRQNPLIGCLTLAIVYVVGSGCCYTLLRKTEI